MDHPLTEGYLDDARLECGLPGAQFVSGPGERSRFRRVGNRVWVPGDPKSGLHSKEADRLAPCGRAAGLVRRVARFPAVRQMAVVPSGDARPPGGDHGSAEPAAVSALAGQRGVRWAAQT
ncbi:hypothetical protein ACF06Q_20970 [Streptomyces leeuwenhoekii]|uniref:hypothetical protein n=1 Tax=Streptomyces leeuwenhoekii TaxID=1437453 RepID=UPI0036F4F182